VANSMVAMSSEPTGAPQDEQKRTAMGRSAPQVLQVAIGCSADSVPGLAMIRVRKTMSSEDTDRNPRTGLSRDFNVDSASISRCLMRVRERFLMKLVRGLRVLVLVAAVPGVLLQNSRLAAQEEKAIVAPFANAKFGPIPNAPECFTVAVAKGDPGTGPSVVLAKFTPGCIAPFHWHTPSETAMLVSGSLEVQMKDDKPMVAHHGDFVFLPPHHVHRATCRGSAPCLVFLTSDAAFDVHWVDAGGKEIPLADAVKNAKEARKSK
jgi:quercetin dioxygenase-like cupin family protein